MAPKRARTPDEEDSRAPAKRRHPWTSASRETPLNFNSCFSDEIVLSMFSYLTYKELCSVQEVHSHWARLANDNTLWKKLFLADHPSRRLRGARGFSSRWVSESGPDGREIKPLPARLRLTENQVYYFPFKWMYRVSRNWRKGRCAVEEVVVSDANEPPPAAANSIKVVPSSLLLAGDMVIYADNIGPRESDLVVQVSQQEIRRSRCPGRITSLALDHSAPETDKDGTTSRGSRIHVASFYVDGTFSILSLPDHSHHTFTETHRSTRRTQSPVFKAVYKHPLLVTLTDDMELSLWDIPSAANRIPGPLQSFRSYTSFPPLSLSLTSTADVWKLLLVHSTPVYPTHWLPSAAEITISDKQGSRKVVESRKSKSYVATRGWLNDDERNEMEAEWSRKLGDVELLETDGKFLVVAGRDNLLQVYRLHYGREFRLAFVRTLSGHQSSIRVLKVADGRCVSAGVDGTLRVWDLESGWDVEVQGPHMPGSGVCGLAFDERRVVTLDANHRSLQIWRFDL